MNHYQETLNNVCKFERSTLVAWSDSILAAAVSALALWAMLKITPWAQKYAFMMLIMYLGAVVLFATQLWSSAHCSFIKRVFDKNLGLVYARMNEVLFTHNETELLEILDYSWRDIGAFCHVARIGRVMWWTQVVLCFAVLFFPC